MGSLHALEKGRIDSGIILVWMFHHALSTPSLVVLYVVLLLRLSSLWDSLSLDLSRVAQALQSFEMSET